MSNKGKMCASCARWALEAASEEQRAAGMAQCTGYDRPEQWNEPFCVLYNPASNLNARRGWVLEFRAAQQQQESK